MALALFLCEDRLLLLFLVLVCFEVELWPCTFLTWFSKFFCFSRPGTEACSWSEFEVSGCGGWDVPDLASVGAKIKKNHKPFDGFICIDCIFYNCYLFFTKIIHANFQVVQHYTVLQDNTIFGYMKNILLKLNKGGKKNDTW